MVAVWRILLVGILVPTLPSLAQLPRGWKTDVTKATIPLKELLPGGPSKDGIPAIDRPQFVPVAEVTWLARQELVISFERGEEARAYPLQILIWHELVNDELGGTPILVSYCPLCNSAIVFDRRVNGSSLQFGVSGLLRNSDMVMFDRQTETLWQQITGEGLVGELSGEKLSMLPSQMVPFEEFARLHPKGMVLSRDTGFRRDYGRNPYVGYEYGPGPIMPVKQPRRLPLPPMEKLVVVEGGGSYVAVPFRFLSQQGLWQGDIGGQEVVIFYSPDALSPLDQEELRRSRKGGAAGVFRVELEGQAMRFHREKNGIVDEGTRSIWSVAGQATSGPLSGKRLRPVAHGVYYAFAWLAFRPDTRIVDGSKAK